MPRSWQKLINMLMLFCWVSFRSPPADCLLSSVAKSSHAGFNLSQTEAYVGKQTTSRL